MEKNTELLTKQGWMPVKELAKDVEIATFNIKDKTIVYEKPLNLSSYISTDNYTVESSYKKEEVAHNHNLIIDGKLVEVENVNNIPNSSFIYAGYLKSPSSNNLLAEIALYTYFSGDYEGYKLHFDIMTKDEVIYLTDLLMKSNLDYTLCHLDNILFPYKIKLKTKSAKKVLQFLDNNADFSFIKDIAILKLLDILISSATTADSNGTITCYTCNRFLADNLQISCILHGISCKIDYLSDKMCNKVTINGVKTVDFCGRIVCTHNTKIQRHYKISALNDGIITRLNGKVNFTG